MKKLFEPIKLRENSRERVLRELISYNDNKGKNEKAAEFFSKNFSDITPQRELKPHKRKNISIVMEFLAGAAVIAIIAGIISFSINKPEHLTRQPTKNTGSQNNIVEKNPESNSGQNNSLQGAISVDTPMIEFISSKNLGVSIAFNRQYFKDFSIEDNGIITLYQADAGTDTGFNWNNIIITGSHYSYEEDIYNWTNDIYDCFYGSLQNISDVTIGNLYFDYLSELGIASNTNATGIPATKFSFSYELPDVNTSECTDVYVIDSSAYRDSLNSETYGEDYESYTIKVSYQIFHNENNAKYSMEPKVIYETIDSFVPAPLTKKTCYILASGTEIYKTYNDGIRIPEHAYFGKSLGYKSHYSFFSSPAADKINDNFMVEIPIGNLYDAAGVRDISTNDNFYSTFKNMVAIDLYYPDNCNANESNYDNSTAPLYCVLHSVFETDDSNKSISDITEKDTVSPTDNMITAKSFEIFPNGDKLIYAGDKYYTIYGISEDFKRQRDDNLQTADANTVTDNADGNGNVDIGVNFNYDYVIYVPIDNIFDINNNSIGNIIDDINRISPSLTMTVYYDGTEQETFPVQIYADKAVIYGLETTDLFN